MTMRLREAAQNCVDTYPELGWTSATSANEWAVFYLTELAAALAEPSNIEERPVTDDWSQEAVKERSKTLCRHCERTIWLLVGPDGSLDSKRWTSDGTTIVCEVGVDDLGQIQFHKPLNVETQS